MILVSYVYTEPKSGGKMYLKCANCGGKVASTVKNGLCVNCNAAFDVEDNVAKQIRGTRLSDMFNLEELSKFLMEELIKCKSYEEELDRLYKLEAEVSRIGLIGASGKYWEDKYRQAQATITEQRLKLDALEGKLND